MLEKDQAKRMKLLEVMDLDYYKFEDHKIEKLIEKHRVAHEENIIAKEEQKQQKAQMQDKFKFLDIKKGGKPEMNSTHNDYSPSRNKGKKVYGMAKPNEEQRNSHSNFSSSAAVGRRKNSANKKKDAK